MNNIKTSEDVLNWAKTIVDAKGDKYIPLAKADMLAIAQFIVDVGASGKEAMPEADRPPKGWANDPMPEKPETSSATAEGKADPMSEVEDKDPTDRGETSTSGGKQTTTATMTRGYALHRAGFTVQQAYDKFLDWAKENPKESSVMDFSTGVKSSNAAFAYWLAEIITVEVPCHTTYTATV